MESEEQSQSAENVDVVVVGSGNAGFSAALAAQEHGARVVLLEKAPASWVGGNSFFTAGAYRITHDGIDDLTSLVGAPDRPVDLPPYSAAEYEADMLRVTQGRCDSELTRILVTEARGAAEWLRDHGIGWQLMFERQSHVVDGRARFWGNLAIGTLGGGQGLIESFLNAAQRAGIEVRFDAPVERLLTRDGTVTGVVYRSGDRERRLFARSVVIASGGFEADPRLRASYLGPSWDIARVRGTPYNTGEVLLGAIDIGAQPYGHWSGCHAIAWDAAAPLWADRSVSNRFSRQGYPFGLVVNLEGERFIDEGADFRNYTYAKYGAEILKQPSSVAFQLFDAQTIGLVNHVDYSSAEESRYEAGSVTELAEKAGIDPAGLTETIERFNRSIGDAAFDPTVRDGKSTSGIQPKKSNWAQPLDQPPYVAFAVTCGITFTFGGVRIDGDARVLDRSNHPVIGLYAAGEAVGGLFYHNYPGGTGLASGSVFGRRAGRSAAVAARSDTAVVSGSLSPDQLIDAVPGQSRQ